MSAPAPRKANRECSTGFSVLCPAPDDSVSSLPGPWASPTPLEEKSSSCWIFRRYSSRRFITLLASRSRSGLRVSVPGLTYLFLRLSAWSASLASPTSRPTMPSADFCTVLDLPLGWSSRYLDGLCRSPEVSSAAFHAQSPDLRSALLMSMDFAVTCLLVQRSRLSSGFCSSTRAFAPRFFQTCLTAIALALR